MQKKKWLPAVVGAVVGIVVLMIVLLVVGQNTPEKRLQKQLDLGRRYLAEMEYEKAVAAFQAAIEIDPKQTEAYLGLAEAYVGLGNYEAALSALEKGYAETQSEVILAKTTEIQEQAQNSEEGGGDTENRNAENSVTVEKVKVPEMEGRDWTEVQEELDGIGLNYELTEENSPYLPKVVLGSDVPAGMEVDKGDTLKLTLSAGLIYEEGAEYEVEDLRGKTEEEAREILAENGIYLLEGDAQYDDEIEAELIAAQDVEVGSTILAGEIITVFPSLGIEQMTVPEMVGKTSEEAVEILEGMNLKVVITPVKKEGAEEGTVLEQDIPANTVVDKYTQVELTVVKNTPDRIELLHIANMGTSELLKLIPGIYIKEDYGGGHYVLSDGNGIMLASNDFGVGQIEISGNATAYSLDGIYVGMDVSEAVKTLADKGYLGGKSQVSADTYAYECPDSYWKDQSALTGILFRYSNGKITWIESENWHDEM